MPAKRLLIYTMYFWPEPSSIGPMSTSLALHLAQNGWEVEVVTGFPNLPEWRIYDGYRGRLFQSETHQQVAIKRSWTYVPARTRSGVMSTWKRILSDSSMPLSGLWPASLCRRPDLILAISPPLQAAAAAILLKSFWRCPLLVWLQDLVPDAAFQAGMMKEGRAFRLARSIESRVYENADRVGVISRAFERNLLRKGVPASRITYLPNGVALDGKFSKSSALPARRRLGLSDSDFVVLHLGAIAARTQTEVALDALHLLRTSRDIHLVFIGEGNLKPQMEERAQHLHLDHVHFLPAIRDEQELKSLLASADAYLLTQSVDFIDSVVPSKLLTYFANNRPVIACVHEQSEAATLLRNAGSGVLVEAGNAGQLAEAILTLKQQPDRRAELAQSGRDFVENHFEQTSVWSRFEAELNSLVA